MQISLMNILSPHKYWLRFFLTLWTTIAFQSCTKDEIYTEDSIPPSINEGSSNSNDTLPLSLPVIIRHYTKLEESKTHAQYNCIILMPDSSILSKEEKIPALYLLHGKDSYFTGWCTQGFADTALSVSIAKKIVPPMAIVIPEALNSYYVNGYQENVFYENFFFQNLIPVIEEKYNIGGCKDKRWIAGNSMGGYGALYYSIEHCNYFSFCYAMSARPTGPMSPIVPSILDYTSYPHDILFYLDIGKADSFLQQNIDLYQKMLEHDSQVSLEVSDGNHTWSFWRNSIIRCLNQLGKLEI